MGRKAKYTVEQRVKACEEYLSGKKSATQIAIELEMGEHGDDEVATWARLFKTNGASIFQNEGHNRTYTKEFKEQVVMEYLSGNGSLRDLAARYSIPKPYTISTWIRKYNDGIELKDYKPAPEIYMADTLKTTLQERIDIVRYCLEHGRDVKATALHFGGNYAQIYQWVRKYEEYGEEGLIDKRGKRKAEEELSELEKAQRRIRQLEAENKRKEMEIELLKKAKALGTSCLAAFPRAKRIHLNKQHRIKAYSLIRQHHDERGWNIDDMCVLLGIRRSSYYKWLKSSPSSKMANKLKEDGLITSRIKEIALDNNSLFGAINMHYALRNEGFKCGHNRVYRLMCINDIKSSYRRASAYHCIRSSPEQTADNVLKRDFGADKPNEKWCTDVTEIRVPKTGEKLFISPMIDLYDRYPVSLEVSDRNDAALANRTLDNAHSNYPDATPLVHSDRGFAYTRTIWKNRLSEYGMTQSMSRVSRCIDNGVCEGFQGQFKDILFILYPKIETKEQMIEAIYGTLDYYINHYPQKRLKGKTCGQVRTEAMSKLKNDEQVTSYPIRQSNRYIKFWADITAKQQRTLERTA